MEALEQIRLAGAVRADRQDEAWTETQLEPRVRAVVAERERLDNQPGLAGEADRHDQVREVVALALDHSRAKRADQLQADLVALH
jgi:hypothetical protein